MQLRAEVLQGGHVVLEPIGREHVDELWGVGNHAELWQHMPFRPQSPDDLAALVERGLAACAAGTGVTFVQRAQPAGEVVGSTSFMAVDPANRRLEIGATWITPAWQRTAINTEAKLLLLTHAFERLDCIRVEFKTDARNERSQQALERIGAQREGTLRHHMVMPDGHLRDSVYYSVLAGEWPDVRQRLQRLLDR